MKRFIVRPPYLGSLPTMEITRERYNNILESYSHLLTMMFIEEKYDILIDNYREIEIDTLEIALNDEIYSEYNIPGFFAINRKLSRRLANILSAARLYLDYLDGQKEKGLKDWFEIIHSKIHEVYDDEPDYRLLEALRNHVQHKGLPFSFSKRSGRVDIANKNYIFFHTSILLRIKEFLLDRKIKGIIRNDLINIREETIELDIPLRHYIALISNINQQIRELTEEKTKRSEISINEIINEYSKINTEYGKGEQKPLALHEWNENERLPSTTKEITNNVLINLHNLVQKNSSLSGLTQRYVTSQSKSDLKYIQEKLNQDL